MSLNVVVGQEADRDESHVDPDTDRRPGVGGISFRFGRHPLGSDAALAVEICGTTVSAIAVRSVNLCVPRVATGQHLARGTAWHPPWTVAITSRHW
jgi:hypothetical protein